MKLWLPILIAASLLAAAVWQWLSPHQSKSGAAHFNPSLQASFPETPDTPGSTQRAGQSRVLRGKGNRGTAFPVGGPAGLQGEAASAAQPPRKRAWDPALLTSLNSALAGDPIRFELLEGDYASGVIEHLQRTNNRVTYVAGRLNEPTHGRFFFQAQTVKGVAGDFCGVVNFARSDRAYRLEPSGLAGAPELVQRFLDEVLCLKLPRPSRPPPDGPEALPPLRPEDFPDLPIPEYQNGIVVLQSLPGAGAVLYLDFQGGYTPTWHGIAYERPAVTNPQIRDVWVRVAEDFMPFNINVTTDLAVFQAAPQGRRQRVIITPTDTAAPRQGGAAYLGSFNWTGDTPCWVFVISGKYCAEACTHEAGHTFRLEHAGQYVNGQQVEYYAGHGSGATGWAPIMGLNYYQNVVQWSKGEYLNAANLQDNLLIITTENNGMSWRPDETGNTLQTSRYLEVYPDGTASAEGVIERTGDVDAFQFTTSGGAVSLLADPVIASPNLAVQVMLSDAYEVLLTSRNPQNTLGASLSTNLPAGTYTFRVTGAARNVPLTSGFSAYGSLGYYCITGSVAGARLPTRFVLCDNATNGTHVGVVPANNPYHDPLSFSIASGNTGNTFAIDNTGTLVVGDNRLLDYAALGSQSQLPVQFELFVNIRNSTRLGLSEFSRRVVIAMVHAPGPPIITEQPQSLNVGAGTNVFFSVVAGRSVPYDPVPFTYQWFFDGLLIPGGTQRVLPLSNVQAASTGEYLVAVGTSAGSVTSAVARLSVNASAPFITRVPASLGAFAGLEAQFSAAAIGTEPVHCQWQRNGEDIQDATNTTLRLANVQAAAEGRYRVIFSNCEGTAITPEAMLVLVPVAAWGRGNSGQTNLPPELTQAVQVSAGAKYNLALLRSGSVIQWGEGAPEDGPPPVTNAIAVAAGAAHGLALTSDGAVLAWGDNSSGQTNVPATLTNVAAIAAGGRHNLALKSDGTVVGWGDTTDGQSSPPVGLSNVVAIAAGNNHSLALAADGRVLAWGNNAFSQAVVPTGMSDVIDIAAGATHSLALRLDGTVVAWGTNNFGQLEVPPGLSSAKAIAAGDFHSLALTSDGSVFAWGAGQTNAFAHPDFGQSIIPATVTNVSAVSAGGAHSVALVGTGLPFITETLVGRSAPFGARVVFRVEAVGSARLFHQWQFNGTYINGATGQNLVLAFATNAGNYRVLVRNSLGTVFSSEAHLSLESSPPTIMSPPAPLSQTVYLGGEAHLRVAACGVGPLSYQWYFNGVEIPGATNATLLADRARRGEYSVVVSNPYGASGGKTYLDPVQVVAWGDNENGQTYIPAGLRNVIRISGGHRHTVALTSDGTVVAWGANGSGQCDVPVGLAGVVDIAAGGSHSLALVSNGTVVAWGRGNYGESVVPVGLRDLVSIAAGDGHSVALTKAGRVVVWGGFYVGTTNVPASATNVIAISAGASHTVALRGDGGLVYWIANQSNISWASNNLTAVAAHYYYCLGLREDGTVGSWDFGWPWFAPPPSGLRDVVEVAAGFNQRVVRRCDGTIVTWGRDVLGLGSVPTGIRSALCVGAGFYHSLVALGEGSAIITLQPCDRSVWVGDQTLLTVTAGGAPPLTYQWQYNGVDLPGATNAWLRLSNAQPSQAGRYRVLVTNAFTAITSREAKVEVWLPLDAVLDAPTLAWTTTGCQAWHGQAEVTRDASGAAQSGSIPEYEQSSLQAELEGPGSLSFWWKVSSEPWFDGVTFYLDGTHQAAISGEVDWQLRTMTVPAGRHTLKWTYAKDGSTSGGQDAAWLDQVTFAPDAPLIAGQPRGGTVPVGGHFELSVSALGTPPLSFQWMKDATNLGQNSSALCISNATRRDSGVYAVTVSNAGGASISSNALLRVLVPQQLGSPAWLPDGAFTLLSDDADGGILFSTDLPAFEPQASTNLLDWVALPNGLRITNGKLLLVDPHATNYSKRFYRVLEQ